MKNQSFTQQDILLLFGNIALVYLLGMYYIDIMDVDAAQYASISREMWETGNYLQVQHLGTDYLDKPPLLFWLSASFFKFFGVHAFVYRLPAVLSTVLGVWATYRLGKVLYDKETGILSALFLASCQGYFLINHDVRTDTMMINFMVFAVWQLYEYIHHWKIKNYLWAVVGVGLSMLSKGPIGLVVPMLAIGGYLLYERNWKMLFRWEWLLGLVLVGIILLPMTIGLYQQHGWEGVEFYYWTQSFGRITGENTWKNDAGFFYFIPTYIWSFLPWIFLAFFGIFIKGKAIIKQRFQKTTNLEVLTFAGFLLPFLALSLSKYKLPHYIYVTFPFTAILAAYSIRQILINQKNYKIFFWIHSGLLLLLWLILVVLCSAVFPLSNILIILIGLGFLGISFYFLHKKHSTLKRLIFPIAFTIIGVNFVLNTHLYPSLMKYQAPSQVGKYIIKNNIPTENVFSFYTNAHSLDFYAQSIIEYRNENGIKKMIKEGKEVWLFTNDEGLKALAKKKIKTETPIIFDKKHVAMLSFKFLNPKTRAETLGKRYLVKIAVINY